MRRRVARRRAVGLLALAAGGALAVASPAQATEGSLYGFGVEALVAQAVPDGQCSVAQTGASFGVTCPPIGTSFTGTKWQIDLRTPVPGSVIEALSWRAVRFHQSATSIAQQVLADGALAWQVAEADIPRSPSQPKAYQVGMRALTASLRLSQTEARQQPNRVWTFLDPAISVRDVEAQRRAGQRCRADGSRATRLVSSGRRRTTSAPTASASSASRRRGAGSTPARPGRARTSQGSTWRLSPMGS